MPDILYPPSRPQSVGEVLDSAIRIFGVTLLSCLPFAALARIGAQLPNIFYLLTGRAREFAFALKDPLWWALYAVGYAIAMMLWSAVLLRQHAIATRQPTSIAATLGRGARRVPGVLLIAILIGLASVACVFPIAFVVGFIQGVAHAASPTGTMVVVALLALLPVSWLLLRWSCSVTVYLLTDRGPVASMSHSWHLTSGSFWRLSLIYTVAVVLVVVLYVLSATITGAATLLLGHSDIAVITAAATAGIILLGAVATPFYCALALEVFGELSVRREGTDLAQRISSPASP